MTKHILLLGGTTEAADLAHLIADDPRFRLTLSLAGRTTAPAALPGRLRSGGFGGSGGLAVFIHEESVDAVVDATHPFAANISANAAAACAQTACPCLLVSRPAWRPRDGDRWVEVADMSAAAAAIAPDARVFLTVGRQELAPFAPRRDVWFLVRMIEHPAEPLPFVQSELLLGRGPFELQAELALFEKHSIDCLITKNSGGSASQPKLDAARRLELPVIMVRRPPLPQGPRVEQVEAAMSWLRDIAG